MADVEMPCFVYYGYEDNRNYNGIIYFGRDKGVQLCNGKTPEELGEKMMEGVARLSKQVGGTPKKQNMPLENCVKSMELHKLHTPRPMDADEEKIFLSALGLNCEEPKE